MSGGEIMIIGKLLLTFGVLLGFSAWDLFKLRRQMRLDGTDQCCFLAGEHISLPEAASSEVVPGAVGDP